MGTLDVFFPEPRRETVAGRTFDILPLRARQFGAYARASAPFARAIPEADYLWAIIHHHDAVVAALAIATGAEPEWLGDLYTDDLLRLLAAVSEVNLDFFARRLLPARDAATAAMRSLMAEREAEMARTGDASSPGSSGADTALPNALN